MNRGRGQSHPTMPGQSMKRPRPASPHGGAHTQSPRGPPFRGRGGGGGTHRTAAPAPFRPRPGLAQVSAVSTRVAPTTASSSPSAPSLFHPFRTTFTDHFETSRSALEDVLPVVLELRQALRPSTPEKFTLYDPYYCSGTVVTLWNDLGIHHVLHENRDFYEDVRLNTVPGPYDMLVTNPPFSDDHIIRMMNFLVLKQDKPWAFLAPDYIVSKPWYKEFVRRHFSPAPPTGKGDIRTTKRAIPAPISIALPPFLLAEEPPAPAPADRHDPSDVADGTTAETTSTTTTAAAAAAAPTAISSSPAALPTEPFYVVPRATYDFAHPTGAGNAHSHFKSMWYVWCGQSTRRQQEVIRGAKVALLARQVQVVHGMVALKESGLVSALQK